MKSIIMNLKALMNHYDQIDSVCAANIVRVAAYAMELEYDLKIEKENSEHWKKLQALFKDEALKQKNDNDVIMKTLRDITGEY